MWCFTLSSVHTFTFTFIVNPPCCRWNVSFATEQSVAWENPSTTNQLRRCIQTHVVRSQVSAFILLYILCTLMWCSVSYMLRNNVVFLAPQSGSRSLQWSETWMEDPQEDPLTVHCFCVCRGSALLGDLLGVSRSMEHDLMSVLLIYPRIFLCVFIVYRHVVRILCLLLYSAICWCVFVALV